MKIEILVVVVSRPQKRSHLDIIKFRGVSRLHATQLKRTNMLHQVLK